ncbi:hypothetical protein [Sorangium sp. So ce426]|uniref:hypothetical protein n=1 Tax=Sorangium sp. So ce426 TaxID=3133312 RepID=UPI003F5B5AA9
MGSADVTTHPLRRRAPCWPELDALLEAGEDSAAIALVRERTSRRSAPRSN